MSPQSKKNSHGIALSQEWLNLFNPKNLWFWFTKLYLCEDRYYIPGIYIYK